MIQSDAPSQADVAVFKAFESAPTPRSTPTPRAGTSTSPRTRASSNLPGDASQEYTTYGPDASEVTVNPAVNPDAEEDVDLFGSDEEEEDAEAAKIREERLAEYKKKKEAKPKIAAKSIVTMDIKPWGKCSHWTTAPLPFDIRGPPINGIIAPNVVSPDDETDMGELEAAVRAIQHDGLVWGASKLVPIGFGIKKLQINIVVEDDKISVSDLEEEIQEIEDYVQSTDVAAMQKL